MSKPDFEYRQVKPDAALADLVESFWILSNRGHEPKEVVVLPDGRIDLSFSWSATGAPHTLLLGLDTEATTVEFPSHTTMLAISFRPLGLDCFFTGQVAGLVNSGKELNPDVLGFDPGMQPDFERFCEQATQRLKELLPAKTDERKQKLFRLIYSSQGSVPVAELAEEVHWSSRQINRYFNQQFGLSLKTYCTILRFRASFAQIKDGKLFPEQHYTDQAHFIREIKKFSVAPGQLSKNKNGRFIQFSTLPGR